MATTKSNPESLMRGLVAFCLLLVLGCESNAQTVPCPANFPAEILCKKIRVFNNSIEPLYVIIESGERPVDSWLQAQFNVQPDQSTRNYASSQVVRIYVNGTRGILPGGSAEVTVPFYTRLSDNTDGTEANQFIDWWNGGRIYFYDDEEQIQRNFENDAAKSITNPKTPGPCVGPVKGNCISQIPIFFRPHDDPRGTGLPPTDRSQLLEYTFADAITAKGKPYTINLNGVGYNISSVDQVYLPVAMEALTEPPGEVQYIGTVMPLGTVNDLPTANTFRGRLAKFLHDFPGWPVYNSSVTPTPPDPLRPRIPGAYNVFANAFTDPYNNVLTKPGATITSMTNLYTTCRTSTAGICESYNQVIKLFDQNLTDYLAQPCHKPGFDTQTEMLKHIYGWVPFNDGCGEKANDLLITATKLGLNFNTFQEQVYTKKLQYSLGDGGTFRFNPYVKLIHDLNYLHMAAYAYSVDDAIGFQSYPGIGLIITYAGDNGLDNKTPLDRTKRVVVSLGVKHQGVPEWSAVGACNENTNKNVDPLFPSVTFYPNSYPCTFTATDLKNAKYQFVIQSAPQNLALDTSRCPALPAPEWCTFAEVVTIDGEKNYINTRSTEPDPPPSTHDFNGDGKSDILWRHSNGQVAMWMMNGGLLASNITLSQNKDNSWLIVGQRDFDRDGKADVLWRHTGGNLERWFLNGTGTGPNVISTQPFGNVSTDWTLVGTGDFNNDGFGDALWRCTSGGANCTSGDVAIWLMNSTTQLIASGVFSGVPLSWSIAGVAHFNIDTNIPGRSDILWRDSTTGTLAIWFMNGVSFVSSANVGIIPIDWTVVGTGDFNGDGYGDILWRCAVTGPNCTSGDLALWLMKGAQVIQTAGFGTIPAAWSVALTGDYNFDGKSDILWRCTQTGASCTDGDVALWFMNGTQVTSTALFGGISTAWSIQSSNAD